MSTSRPSQRSILTYTLSRRLIRSREVFKKKEFDVDICMYSTDDLSQLGSVLFENAVSISQDFVNTIAELYLTRSSCESDGFENQAGSPPGGEFVSQSNILHIRNRMLSLLTEVKLASGRRAFRFTIKASLCVPRGIRARLSALRAEYLAYVA